MVSQLTKRSTPRSPQKTATGLEMKKMPGTPLRDDMSTTSVPVPGQGSTASTSSSIAPSVSNMTLSTWSSGASFIGKDHFSLLRRVLYDFARTVPVASIVWFVLLVMLLAGLQHRLEQFFREFSFMGLDKVFFADMLDLAVTAIMGCNAVVLAITFLTSGVFQETFARRFCRERGLSSTLKAQGVLNVLRAAYLCTYLCILAIFALSISAMAMLVIWATISAVCEEVVEAGPALQENQDSISEAIANLKDTGITPDMVATILHAVQGFCSGREKTYTSVSNVMFLGILTPLMQINLCMCVFSNLHHMAHEVERARVEEDGNVRARQELERAVRAKELEWSMQGGGYSGTSVINPLSPAVISGPESPSRVV